MKAYDYVVLGGGAIGMAIAYKLAAKAINATIAVIDHHTDSAASSAAGAMLGCFGEVTKYTFSHQAYKEKFDFMYAAHTLWPEWMGELENASGEKIWHNPGTHIILNTQGGKLDEDNFEAIIAALKKYNEPFEEVNPRNIQGLDATAFAKPLRALYINEGAVDSHQYLEVLKKACVKKNVEFINGQVTKIMKKHDQFTLVGDFDEVVSENVILATGAFTDILLRNSDLEFNMMPVFAGVGFAMTTQARGQSFKNTIRVANRSGSCGLHVIPYGDKREYVGATNIVHTAPQQYAPMIQVVFLSKCVVEQLKRDINWSSVERYRVGNRPVSFDTFPLIGKTSLNGFFVATGTYRDGFHCSPVIAQNMVNEILGEKRIISDMFKPERRPIQTLTQEESIKDYAMQSLSGAYELWLELPGTISEKDILSMYEQKARDIYRKLEINSALNTDILFCLSMPTFSDEAILELKKYLHE